MPFRLLFLFIFSWSPSLAIATDCEEWNTEEFFQTASLEDVKTCLSQGANPKARSRDGNSPLHHAARLNDDPAMITALLDAGADPRARSMGGHTPLHRAAIGKGPAVITALLDAGADPKARNEDGKTPWDIAKDREDLQDSDVYWRLHDGQF